MERLTVFTPTYNRANLLQRCYESVMRQTNLDFIWMIIDDGSTDGTQEIVQQWIRSTEKPKIEYYYKENGGLHTAYNEAIAHTETELCMCIDSDDWMPDDAVERVLSFWEANGSTECAGIVGLDFYPDGKVVGDPLPDQKRVNLIDLLTGKYPIHNGDRTNAVRTELYKKYAPMQVFPGEKNFNPHYMHLQISREFDFLVLNENLRFVEYQPEGMSNSMLKQYRSSPNSFAEIRKLYLSFPDTSWKFRLRHSIHLVSSCTLAGSPLRAFRESPQKLMAAAALLPGILLSVYIKLKTR